MNNDEIIISKVCRRRGLYYLSCSDGNEYKIESEIFFKYKLDQNTSISKNKFIKILEDNSYRLCHNSAMRLLTQRMHSSYEVGTKLKKKGFSAVIVKKNIEYLKKINLLNDEIFASNYIEELIYRGYGRYKIIYSLQKRGISNDTIRKKILNMYNYDLEKTKAGEEVRKKIKSLAYKKIEKLKLKEKLVRYLASRGFSSDIIFKVVEIHLE